MIRKLRRKFLAIIMALLTLLLGCIFGLIYYFTQESLEEESLNTMDTLAEASFQPGRLGEVSGRVNLPYCVLQISSYGELVAASGGYYDLSDREFLQELISVAVSSFEVQGEIPQYHLRYGRYLVQGGQRLVFVDTTSEQATLRGLLKTSFLIGGLSLLCFFAVSFLLARWIVRPVEYAWQQQKQFVADASHELKTPLTVITTNAELLRSPDYAPEAKEQFSANILTMARQMRGLVESLLRLARVEQPKAGAQPVAVDLSRLVEDATLPFEALFFERELTLETLICPGIHVQGEPAQLRQILEILLDNAQKYATPPGLVRVTLSSRGRHARLSVANSGEPLSVQAREDIFKRFYRLDEARQRDGSFGLGLSIAQAIAEAHQGKIWCESEGGLNIFYVELPL